MDEKIMAGSQIIEVNIVRSITKMDLDVIRHVCLPYKVAAPHLGLKINALKVRVNRLMIVFGVENRTALATKAISLKLLKAEDFWMRDYANENTKDISGKNN
jgi:hypothetical protein